MLLLGSDNVNTKTPNPFKPCAREGYTGFWYGCYKKHHIIRTWGEAKSICADEGAYLVTIIHDAENAAMELATTDDDSPVWTGGRDVGVR